MQISNNSSETRESSVIGGSAAPLADFCNTIRNQSGHPSTVLNSGDQFCRCGTAGKIAQSGCSVAKTGASAPYDFDAAFQRLSEGLPQMLLVLSSPFFAPARSRIAELAIRQRLPTMLYVEAGGLMSYGVNAQANYRQLGFYAAKILNGAKPADLPVQQAVRFELVINLKTAKAIGVDVSTAIQLRADEVIE
jgi:putative ABC transport system substrate-binding protein